MRWWEPAPDEPALLDWWRPLLAASRRARADRVPWPIHVDEFDLVARARRAPRPDVWVYRHRGSGGAVCADAHGRTYGFTSSRADPAQGRFTEVDVRRAVWRAGLPQAVEPVWHAPPSRAAAGGDEAWDDGWDDDDPPGDRRAAPGAVRGARRHLRLVAGGGTG